MNNMEEVIATLARIEAHAEQAKKTLIRHDKAIFGNGQEGLTTEVSKLKLKWSFAKYFGGAACLLVMAEVINKLAG